MIVSDTHSFAQIVAREIDHASMQKSVHMKQISAGKKLVNSGLDVGALSSAIQQSANLKKLHKISHSLQNAISFSRSQTSALVSINNVYERMAELAVKSLDITKSDRDRLNFDREFQELRQQTLQIDLEKFNGKDLFRNTLYSVVITGGTNWEDARALAREETVRDGEYEHYLATITSLDEQQEIDRQLGNSATANRLWLGGSDGAFEGEWRWVEGPEGKEEGGDGTNYLGRLFWDLDENVPGEQGETGVDGAYLNWDVNEPNNSPPPKFPDENALHTKVDLGDPSKNGKWNDYSEDSDNYVQGYLRESDPKDIKVGNDSNGGSLEIKAINFMRFLPSTSIDLKSIENSKDALSRLSTAIDDVLDKIATTGSNLSRLDQEISAIENTFDKNELALSRLEDSDFARAATQLAKAEIKIHATAAVFAQANELFNKRNYVEELL